ncbi:3-isopropylmalate dehydratase small subunit 1 [Prochlorococcus marinus str. MIT 1313]|uniref:3-isopropylmalate dehydratase small subunit n=1 Tax=Prochlorococcus TaxID=1218 RepID=UPI0007B32404|nr:3-isopropylmalate dehydratase small subunit [Prochlorococcus marinus]KZR68458.1 3-isopropylmalate dehydratase small subunit 1 [Prochlorococcus marinus str. MIT 1313]KZR71305.1 3-isopropylmalate dehydratase small subunit 1 [Prochlorococcus marinus str. MIT 1318]
MTIEAIPFPHGPIDQVRGRAVMLRGDDIDTDRIIPARFLKCVSFEALGDQVFEDDRLEMVGSHPFDLKVHQGASILIVNDNFGCGSSREHAPQALMRWGVRALIGQSFAEIFYGNCLALGIPCATAAFAQIDALQQAVEAEPSQSWVFNLQAQQLTSAAGSWDLQIESGPREMLLSGRWDATSQLVAQDAALKRTMADLPYLNDFVASLH